MFCDASVTVAQLVSPSSHLECGEEWVGPKQHGKVVALQGTPFWLRSESPLGTVDPEQAGMHTAPEGTRRILPNHITVPALFSARSFLSPNVRKSFWQWQPVLLDSSFHRHSDFYSHYLISFSSDRIKYLIPLPALPKSNGPSALFPTYIKVQVSSSLAQISAKTVISNEICEDN